jgi:hypothetical protein
VSVLERFIGWVDAEDTLNGRAGVRAFRMAFASIWLVYDVLDIGLGATERALDWYPHARDPGLVVVQLVLVASGAMLLWGRGVWAFGMTAAAARAVEGLVYFPLNDFFVGSVFLLLIAHSTGGPFREGRRPKWVHDALLAQLAFIYAATAVLKMNPDWLGGGHLYVRTQYLFVGAKWPYPEWLEQRFANPGFDALLSQAAIVSEVLLACVLLARRPYWLGAALTVAVHGFGAFITNVWFLSATMIASVLCLLPRGEGGDAAQSERAPGAVAPSGRA